MAVTHVKLMEYVLVLLSIIPLVISDVCDVKTSDGSITMEWFNPIHKMCCGHKLSQRKENSDCCGGSIYYHNIHICCNNKLYDKRVPRQKDSKKEMHCYSKNADCVENICCGNEIFRKDESMFCCNGQKVVLDKTGVSNRDFLDCCGTSVVDVRKTMCCGGVTLTRDINLGCCGVEAYIKTNRKCVLNKIMPITQMFCGQKEYDRFKHTCCDEHLVENEPEIIKDGSKYIPNPNAKCCGTGVIGRDQKCCDNRTGFPAHGISNHSYLECCGLGSYNTDTQFCLKGIPIDKSPYLGLCGNQTINTTFQKCCANKLPYNFTEQECCDGARYCVINKGESCCNGFKMRENEICCESRKPCKKRNPNDDGCCYDYERDNGQTFTSRNETCHNGQIYHMPSNFQPCGLRDFYNPDDQFCCANEKYHHRDGQCCNGKFSSVPLTHGKCCIKDGLVYKLNDKSNPCLIQCNKKEMYDPFHELCCEGRKFKSTGENYCCGPFAINSYEKWCCGEKIPYSINSRRSCCMSTQVYNRHHFHCLKSGEVESKNRKLSDTQKLCYPSYVKSFDGGIQQACRREIAIRGNIVDVKSIHNAGGDHIVQISMTKVKHLERRNGRNAYSMTTKNMTFDVHISRSFDCPITHLKQFRKVIVLFDQPDEGIQNKIVNIAGDAPFFFTRRTFLRRYAITKAATKYHCKGLI